MDQLLGLDVIVFFGEDSCSGTLLRTDDNRYHVYTLDGELMSLPSNVVPQTSFATRTIVYRSKNAF